MQTPVVSMKLPTLIINLIEYMGGGKIRSFVDVDYF